MLFGGLSIVLPAHCGDQNHPSSLLGCFPSCLAWDRYRVASAHDMTSDRGWLRRWPAVTTSVAYSYLEKLSLRAGRCASVTAVSRLLPEKAERDCSKGQDA